MALATQCPFCQTVFRVAGDQLKLRGGLVRCGKCNEVFDGGSHLYPPAPGAWPTLPTLPTLPTPASTAAPASPAFSAIAAARANAAAPHYGEPPAPALPDAATLADIEAAWDLPPSDEIDAPDQGGNKADADAEAGAALMIEDDDVPELLEMPDAGAATEAGAASGEGNQDRASDNRNRPFAGLPLQPSAAPHDTLDPRNTGTGIRYRTPPAPSTPTSHQPTEVDFDSGFRIGADETDPETEASAFPDTSNASGASEASGTAWEQGHDIASDDQRFIEDDPADDRREPGTGADPEVDSRTSAAAVFDASAEDGNLGYQPVEADYMVHQLGFVQQAQRQERWRRIRRVALIAASIVLLLGAIMQGIYIGRNRIAAAIPSTRPLLEAACVRLQCSVGLQRQIDQLSIEANDLQASAPGQPALTLQLLLRNRSDMAQVWPHIELTLNDNDEKPLIRKVFAPDDYLRATLGAASASASASATTNVAAWSILRDKGMAPNSEQPVKLSFVLPQAIASGYRVYLFYP